jgi:hypothetical protein
MPNRTLTILFSSVLFTSCVIAGAQEIPTKNCAYDRARMLALDENQFDQDMSGGWRALSSTPGCELAAADLLRDYREAHGDDWGLLYWHEAQLRAFVGQYKEAIALMKHSYMPADKADWNAYVDATIAFLRRDSDALKQAKVKLAAFPAPPKGANMPPIVNGYMEVKLPDGTTRKMRWPPNIDVVEGLQKCFDMPYVEAYKEACRRKN